MIAAERLSVDPALCSRVSSLSRTRTPEFRRAGGFDTATPLWFHILKEVEVLADGEHLGSLGSILVADTLVGLIVNDPESCWNRSGGVWSPSKFRKSKPIDSYGDMPRFCGMLS